MTRPVKQTQKSPKATALTDSTLRHSAWATRSEMEPIASASAVTDDEKTTETEPPSMAQVTAMLLLLAVLCGEWLTVHEAAQQQPPAQAGPLEHAAALDVRLACRGNGIHVETGQRPPPPPQVRYLCTRMTLPAELPLPGLSHPKAQAPPRSRGTHFELCEQALVRAMREPDYSTVPCRGMAQGWRGHPRIEYLR